MTNVVYLAPDEEMFPAGDGQPWLIIEATADGLFFGTGVSGKRTGEWVGYRSLPEDDTSFEAALLAAREWAEKYGVPTIWVQLEP